MPVVVTGSKIAATTHCGRVICANLAWDSVPGTVFGGKSHKKDFLTG